MALLREYDPVGWFQPEEKKDPRRETMEAFGEQWEDGGRGPEFEIDELAPVRGPWGTWRSTFTYTFNRAKPWLPGQIVRQLSKLITDRAHEYKTEAVTLGLEKDAGTDIGRDARTAHVDAIVDKRYSSFKAQNLRNIPRSFWTSVLNEVVNADRYDTNDGITDLDGNRMSRLQFVLSEHRIQGGGARIARALGVPDKSLVDLPMPENSVLCGQACLAYAHASTTQRAHYRKPTRATAFNAAVRMAEALGNEGRMAVTDFDAFTALHPQYCVTVMGDKKTVLARTPCANAFPQYIYLLLHEAHYYYISNIGGFARPRGSNSKRHVWCDDCMECFSKVGRGEQNHVCKGVCARCTHTYADAKDKKDHFIETKESCPDCNFDFLFEGCKAFHRCKKWKCGACRRHYPLGRAPEHKCGEKYCGYCAVYTPPDMAHRCFVLPVGPGKKSTELWCYDIESTLDLNEAGVSVHTVALVIAGRVYADEATGRREFVTFHHDRNEAGDITRTAAENFLTWCAGLTKATTLIAHNGAGYDAYLLRDVIKKKFVEMPTGMVMDGQKVVTMKWGRVRFVDSMRHVAGSLERVAKTFGLTATKGFFPYTFFTSVNCGYVGDIPPFEAFETERMNPARRSAFVEWYARRELGWFFEDDPYNLMDECVKYCRLDVELLCLAMASYRDAGIAATGVDPLQKLTIASYAQHVYRHRFMPEAQIAILNREEDEFSREGFSGGRTDVRQVLRSWTPEDVKAGRYALYKDVTSMYPWVQSCMPLPVGPPSWDDCSELITAESCAAYLTGLAPASRCAMVECDVVCPADLYHPVLLSRRDGRLVGDLKVTSGVWTSIELVQALEVGYTVTRITRSLSSATSTELFASYVDFYFQMKARHAPNGPAPNRGLYLLAKMMLNSLWGKFGQNEILDETRFYTDPQAWFRTVALLHNGRLATVGVHEETPEYLLATLTKNAEGALRQRTTNSMLAAFVTAHGRLKLYSALLHLGEQVIYHDTDSVVYESGPGLATLEDGVGLGEWTDETVLGDGTPDPIVRFAGLAPKTYAYRTVSGAECIKSKGFASGFTLSEYEDLARGYLDGNAVEPKLQERLQFRRLDGAITSKISIKKLAVSLHKVAVVSASRTLPFGHREL